MVMKAVLFSLVLVLVTSFGAFGSILQDQVFNVGSANSIHLIHGIQNADSTQNLVIDLSQVGSGSGLTVASVNVLGRTTQFGGLGLLGSSSLLGTSSLHASALLGTSGLGGYPMLGMTSLLMPHSSSALQMGLARSLLLSQLLAAN